MSRDADITQLNILLALILLVGCISFTSEQKSDETSTLIFLLERPLSDEEISRQIAILESRLQYLGFKVESIYPVRSVSIKARISGKGLSSSDKIVLTSRVDVKVWVENLYAFSIDDAADVGEVMVTEAGLWGVRMNITGEAGKRYTEAVRHYRNREVINNYVFIDGRIANLSIEPALRESAEKGLIESVTFIFDKPHFAKIIVTRKKFGKPPAAVLGVFKF